MAQNWNVKQALAAINKGNKEAITDIGRRFPLTSNILARIGEDKAAGELINALPDYITVRKIESILKDGVQVDDSDNDVDVDDEIEADEKPAKKEASKATAKKAAKSKKEEAEESDSDDDAEESDDTEEAGPYDGKNAMELFKECKKRGIKAAPKKPAKYYVDLLTKDDAKNDTSDEDDDSEEEEEEEEKPAKKETKKKAPAKKAAKKEEPEDDGDDDDDWDI